VYLLPLKVSLHLIIDELDVDLPMFVNSPHLRYELVSVE